MDAPVITMLFGSLADTRLLLYSALLPRCRAVVTNDPQRSRNDKKILPSFLADAITEQLTIRSLKSRNEQVTMPTDRRHSLFLRPSSLWPLLALLLASQASAAAHQFEHAADELHETCSVCLLFERNDELLAAAEAKPLSAAKPAALAVESPAASGAQVFCHYRSRASP